MRIIIELKVDNDAVAQIITALTVETFSEACCIGSMPDGCVYLKCPDTNHGVILNTSNINNIDSIQWAINALRESVSLG